MPCILQKADQKDIPYLSTLIPPSVRVLSEGFYSREQIEQGIAEIFGIDSQLVADGTYYMAVAEKQKIVGCGGWSKRKTLYGGDKMKAVVDDLLDPARDAARIRAFFIDPAWSRRGIGSQIMKRCEKDAALAGFSTMKLVATLPGEQLYKRFGYTQIERYNHVLSSGLDFPVVSMQKKLS